MEAFILELGSGFCFVARQKRLQSDGDDFYIDLVFYNRKLRRLLAIDLKVGAFKPEYKGWASFGQTRHVRRGSIRRPQRRTLALLPLDARLALPERRPGRHGARLDARGYFF